MHPLTLEEYAAAMKMHPDTIRKWCRLGKIKARKSPGGKNWLIYENPKA